MFKLYVIDKKELAKGEKEEAEEHGFSPDVALRTAKDHLEKKDPHYYTKLDQYGLEQEEEIKEYKTGFGSGKMGDSSHAQSRKSTATYPYIKTKHGTKKETRLGPIKAAAKKGPITVVGTVGIAKENKED